MYRTLRVSSIVLVVALVSALAVAFTPHESPEAKAALGPVQAVTLTGADFHPSQDGTDFHNNGGYVRFDGVQVARIPFPAETVVITSIKARVYDDHADDMCVTLYRSRPADADEDYWADACSSGQSTVNPQTVSMTIFKRVGRYHTAYLWAHSNTNTTHLRLYGATVFYRVVT
jgi:hypothetical protein